MKKVPCPRCARPAEFSPANRWRPFCSERCKINDLGAWASGEYVIAGNPDDRSSEDLSPEAPAGLPPQTH
jgi:endogenous inhibitor of DNA gyrase (YacG/DUF329 family)